MRRLLARAESLLARLERSSNPDFTNLRIQFRMLVAKMYLDSHKFGRAIEALVSTFSLVELELKVRLERLKSQDKR